MEAKSLGDVLRRSVARFGSKTAVLVPERGKEDFLPLTYAQFGEKVRSYAAALHDLGVVRGDRVAILGENAVEWAFADWACQTLGVVVVPIYPTLPADQAEYIVRDSGAKVVLCSTPDQMKKVACTEGLRKLLLKGEGSLDELSLTSTLDPAAWNAEIDKTQLDDVATIIYTSGTTGQPKGAMLPHRAAIHVCWSASHNLPLNGDDTFLSFLPQSHVYERIAGQFLPIYLGATLGYAKSLASLANDLMKVRPTVLLCVPRFLEAFRERILDGISKLPARRQKLVRFALDQGIRRTKGQFAPLAGLLDKVVLSKLRERTGGRMRYFVSGGAALAPEVAEFYMGLGLTVLQGYGLTETAGGTIVNRPSDNRYWTVGEPLDMEVRLADDGEILVRGAGLMLGYYNLPEETAKVIDADGWFHTGDIGEFEGKHLKITDRKKDLLVLGNGKNVAPQPIENKLRTSPFIAEAVLFGDGKDHISALIVPNFEFVRKTLGLPESEVLSGNEEAKKLIKREVDRINRTLASFEMVKKHALLDHGFSVDSGELTPTLKVKRKVVREKYADVIKSL